MIVTLLGLWLTLLAAGDTPIGRLLRHCLIEAPAARLARISRGAVLAWLVLGAIGAALFWMLEDEGLRLFAMALPELAGWISMFEIGTLVDALAAAALAASSLRIGAVRAWLARPMARSRHIRTRRRRPTTRAANDDDDPALAWAA
ncbi:hypothetical protein AB2M62_19875 [Sphingomonas sp. MMS12-HWE2-04]|uniref:hypothetical protein n=1 Tax=Sphingomonas sp. MMS12-HWE2-04 TaxID=3234199 RepID=UPI00384AEB0D